MTLDNVKFEEKLNELTRKKAITKDTSNTYLSCVSIITDMLNTGTKDIFTAIHELGRNKSQVTKYINAVRKYEELVLKKQLISEPEENDLRTLYKSNTKTFTTRELCEEKYFRKINGIHDLKTRLTLRLEAQSGLRVSELAKLNREDITFKDGEIYINVIEGKGRKQRVVKVRTDSYLYKNLQKYIEENKDNKLFLNRKSIGKKAKKRDIETHDLRRINARLRLNDEMEKGKKFKEAREAVRKELGHSLPATTDIYLGRKVKSRRSEDE